ncbi:hypothetical protein AURDEDRAFT_181344 [Auricularia subglabra TFB-10046 SS5]|nr:hypothetical protein AURDEDRAFT_181344 [Auricularia subglabra TFB-10046 SS5]
MDELGYSIDACSSYSAQYVPSHIRSRDTSLSARWVAAQALEPGPQWVLVKLEAPSIVKSVLFGKAGIHLIPEFQFHKTHPCNVRDFEVHIGLEPDKMTLALRDRLQNNGIWESYHLKWRDDDGTPIATRYVKIMPISTYHPSFHPTLWHVALYGTADKEEIEAAVVQHRSRKEQRMVRLMAKYLQQRGLDKPSRQLLAQHGLELEHSTLSSLREAIESGDWNAGETIISEAAQQGLFDDHIHLQTPQLSWKCLIGANTDTTIYPPCGRMDHLMCIDPVAQRIFMLGGWNGGENMRDLHVYSIRDDKWQLLSADIEQHGGPSTLSKSRMVLDPNDGCLYLFVPLTEDGTAVGSGEPSFAETLLRITQRRQGFFAWYRYQTRPGDLLPGDSELWQSISLDVSRDGGPKYSPEYDVTIDTKARAIYMRTSPTDVGDPTNMLQSQMYAYDIVQGTWTQLTVPKHLPPIPGRMCTLHGEDGMRLWMLGQNAPSCTMSILSLNVEAADIEATPLSPANGVDFQPAPTMTAEHVFGDEEWQEFYVCPESKEHATSPDGSSSKLWTYQRRRRRWLIISPAPKRGQPPERVLFQTVYDPSTHSFFQFGGLPVYAEPAAPLDQLWQARIVRPSRDDVVRRALFLVRKQQFIELCHGAADDEEALEFLRASVVPVLDNANREESAEFRELVQVLYERLNAPAVLPPSGDGLRTEAAGRRSLFQSLMDFVNASAQEPAGDILDIADAVL